MNKNITVIILLLCLLVITGCFEDQAELTLNADGSGFFKQKMVISERMMAAIESGEKDPGGPVTRREEIEGKIGSSSTLELYEQKDLPDGSRIIEYSGRFSDPADFFLSNYCTEILKIRLVPADENSAAIYSSDAIQDDNFSMEKIYMMAKGLDIKRTIHLPCKVIETNGTLSKNKKTVSWEFSLKDRDSMKKAKAFVEGPDKGKRKILFARSDLNFTLPLVTRGQSGDQTKDKSNEQFADSNELKAEIIWCSSERKYDFKEKKAEISGLKFGVELTWGDNKPVAYKTCKLTSIRDDRGNDLVKDRYNSWRRDIHSYQKKLIIEVEAEPPGEDAGSIEDIAGIIDVVISEEKEIIRLKNLDTLVGKESVGHPVLDKLNFKILKISGHVIEIRIDGGNNTISSIEMFRDNGEEISKGGGMGAGDKHTYEFHDSLDKAARCKLEVITAETIVQVPFGRDKIILQ